MFPLNFAINNTLFGDYNRCLQSLPTTSPMHKRDRLLQREHMLAHNRAKKSSAETKCEILPGIKLGLKQFVVVRPWIQRRTTFLKQILVGVLLSSLIPFCLCLVYKG